MIEVWKDIQGYEGMYQVSNFGRIKSLKRNTKSGVIMEKSNNNGYEYVALCKNGKPSTKKIHRLVAEAFIPNPDNLPCVNHKDENKANNIVDNLEWITIKDNANYGTRNARIAAKHPRRGFDMAAFKRYLRSLMRQLKALKEAMVAKDFEKAEKLLDELIDDTQKNIED